MLEARIIGVADVVELMVSYHPHRPAPGIEKAREEITTNRGMLYGPTVADSSARLFKERKLPF